MSRTLLILVSVLVAHHCCGTTAHAVCGDYLQTATDRVHEGHDIAGMPLMPSGHGGSCDEAPDRPSSPTAPLRAAPIVDPAALGRGSHAIVRGERSSWERFDEAAASGSTGRIDRPPRDG